MAIPKNGKKKSLFKEKKEKEKEIENIKVAIEKGSSIGPYNDKVFAKDIFMRYIKKGLPPRVAQRAMIKLLKEMAQNEADEYAGRY
tara:strand:- start:181 stop:438 length:258 start_codon:yes stop_codon:yes gene_type:complete